MSRCRQARPGADHRERTAYISAKRVRAFTNNREQIAQGTLNTGTPWVAGVDPDQAALLLLTWTTDGEELRVRLDFSKLVESLVAAEAADADRWEPLRQGDREGWWGNSILSAHVQHHDEVIHISYHRRDRAPIRDWRIGQRLKNQLAGPEYEGVEIYPAESRLVDTSNEFHLRCLPAEHPVVEPFVSSRDFRPKGKTGPTRKPIEVRFWPKVDTSGGPDACWPWTGATVAKGYGRMSRPGRSGEGKSPYFTHRLAYCLANGIDYGSLAEDLIVINSCDNPPCCNPAHLSAGSQKDNLDDMAAKGRGWWQTIAKAKAEAAALPDDDAEYEIWAVPWAIPFGFDYRDLATQDQVDESNSPGAVQRDDPDADTSQFVGTKDGDYMPVRTPIRPEPVCTYQYQSATDEELADILGGMADSWDGLNDDTAEALAEAARRLREPKRIQVHNADGEPEDFVAHAKSGRVLTETDVLELAEEAEL